MAGREDDAAIAMRERLFAAFFVVAFLFLLYQLYLFLAPFGAALVLAAILALTFAPVTPRVTKALRGSPTLGALAMSSLVTALVLLPTGFLLGLLVNEASHAYATAQEIRAAGGSEALIGPDSWAASTWRSLVQRFPPLASVDLVNLGLEVSRYVSAWIAEEGAALARNLVAGAINVSMMLVALFFFFRDGDRIAEIAYELIPMAAEDKRVILSRLYETVTAVVQSSLVISVVQGLLAGVAYALLGGLSVSVLLGFVTGVAALIPVAGATLVWLPTAIYLLFAAELWRGIALLVWGVVVIGSVDNFVRPLVIGGRVKLPTLLLLFALFGGLQVYGFLGIFVAPVVLAVLLAFVEIYRERWVGA